MHLYLVHNLTNVTYHIKNRQDFYTFYFHISLQFHAYQIQQLWS